MVEQERCASAPRTAASHRGSSIRRHSALGRRTPCRRARSRSPRQTSSRQPLRPVLAQTRVPVPEQAGADGRVSPNRAPLVTVIAIQPLTATLAQTHQRDGRHPALLTVCESSHGDGATPKGVEEPRLGRPATANADLRSLSYGHLVADSACLLGAEGKIEGARYRHETPASAERTSQLHAVLRGGC